MNPIKFIHGVNTSEEQVRANVKWALAHSDDYEKLEDRRCLIVGGGPSLDIEDLALCRSFDTRTTVFALNNAWSWIIKNGLSEPDYVVVMDARPGNSRFAGRLNRAYWLVASQCHADLFHELDECSQPIKMWHVAGSEVVEEEGLRGIPGGGTVLSRTINIATEMGFRHILLAGVDSSHDGDKHHAYDQPMNDGEKRIGVTTPAGSEFVTTAELAEQADTVMNQMLTLERTGVKFELLGEGLLPTLWREHNELRSNPDVWEPEKYRRIWNHSEYGRHSPALRKMEDICANLEPRRMHVVDFGCGSGKATADLIERGWDATGVDFAANARAVEIPFIEANLWSLPDTLKGEAGICVDVMEHIPPEKVDAVLENIARTVPKCIFSISYRPDAMGQLIGERLHLSVHSEGWWIKKLGEHFASVSTDNDLIICEVD